MAAVEAGFEKQVNFLGQLVRHASLRNQESGLQAFVEAELRKRGYAVDRFRTDVSQIGKHPAFSPATVDYAEAGTSSRAEMRATVVAARLL